MKLWVPILGLEKWDFSIEMDPQYLEGIAGNASLNVGAECLPSYEYEAATIRFSVPTIAAWSDAALESLIVHELLHCVLNEAKLDEHLVVEEHLTTVLTRALQKAASRQS